MTANPGTRSRQSYAVPITSIVIGVGYLVAGWVGDNIGFGLFGLALMTAIAVVLVAVRGRSETVQGLLDRRDERINALDLKATAIAGGVVLGAVIVAFMVQIGRGVDPAPYTWLGALGGITYLVALIVLRFRD